MRTRASWFSSGALSFISPCHSSLASRDRVLGKLSQHLCGTVLTSCLDLTAIFFGIKGNVYFVITAWVENTSF